MDQLPVLSLHPTIARGKPHLEPERLIVEDDRELEATRLERGREHGEVRHVEVALIQARDRLLVQGGRVVGAQS
jgi:L-arabinose isomerase